MFLERLGMKLLLSVDAETAHGLSITAMKMGLVPACRIPPDPRLSQTVAGLAFPNPLGMAAGYDKNCEVPDALFSIGFGFAFTLTIDMVVSAAPPERAGAASAIAAKFAGSTSLSW